MCPLPLSLHLHLPLRAAVSAEIIGAMILAGTLAREAKLTYASAFVYFPLCVHAVDIVVSSLGILSLGDGDPRNVWGLSNQGIAELTSLDPMRIMQRGYYVAISAAGVIFLLLTRFMLYEPSAPSAWIHFFGCGAVGMLTSVVFLKSTQYYTDYQYEPVRSIAAASTTGHGTNIITGVSVGMKSTAIPVIMVSVAVRHHHDASCLLQRNHAPCLRCRSHPTAGPFRSRCCHRLHCPCCAAAAIKFFHFISPFTPALMPRWCR